MPINEITSRILGAAYRIHSALGPGLLETAYETCLEHELLRSGLGVRRQVQVPVRYDNITLDVGYRMDLLVEDLVAIEVKAVEKLIEVHRAQLLTYLRFADLQIGLLLNFNVQQLKHGGIVRVVNGLRE